MFKKLFYSVLCLTTLATAWSTPLKPYLFNGKCEDLSFYYQYLEDCDGFDSQQVLNCFRNGNFVLPEFETTFNKGFTNCSYWLALDIKNVTLNQQKMIWSFYNNGLEFWFYELKNNQLVFIEKSSMHQSIKDRPYPVRSISFPFLLNKNESKILFVKVKPTMQGNVYFPTDITNVEDY
jgi:hypothetical protein